jgi:hypothetical protein
MNAKTFASLLKAFSDNPIDSTLVDRGEFLVQVNDNIVQGTITQREGEVYVTENGVCESAGRWVSTRLGRLPQLADRLLERLEVPDCFVVAAGHFQDTLERVADDDDDGAVDDAIATLQSALDRPPAGVSSVVYVTSDAGEGKTTLINRLAQVQALRYKNKEASWLVLPVALGGRPFLRYDDIIIGALANRFRFTGLNMESLVELCKLGFIVLAFDGFEEMFIENSAGEANTALGKLVGLLEGNGAVVVAARKAFFEFKGLRAQSRVYESFQAVPAVFSRLELSRWDKNRFVTYAKLRHISAPEEMYEDLRAVVDEDHPLLTRAVLIKKVCDIAQSDAGRRALLERIRTDANDHFKQVIGVIVQREASEKWTARTGDAAVPLLTENEHYDLLAAIALEMWQSGTESLSGEVVDFTADLFSESVSKDSFLRTQILQRVKQHPLLKVTGDGKYEFDHVEFYHHSLGRALASLIASQGRPRDIRHALQIAQLPDFAIEICAKHLKTTNVSLSHVVELLNRAVGAEARMSIARENASALTLACIQLNPGEQCTVMEGIFGPDKLMGVACERVTFARCYFHRTDMRATSLRQCKFQDCEFSGIGLDGDPEVADTTIENCRIEWVRLGDTTFYDPERINPILARFGFSIASQEMPVIKPATDPTIINRAVDTEMQVVHRLVRLFSRTTGASESLLRLKLGNRGNIFCEEMLPELLKAGLLREVAWHGGGQDRRFALASSLEDIEKWLNECDGSYEQFLAAARSSR